MQTEKMVMVASKEGSEAVTVVLRQDGEEWSVVAQEAGKESHLHQNKSHAAALAFALSAPKEKYVDMGYSVTRMPEITTPLAIMAEVPADRLDAVTSLLSPLGIGAGKDSIEIFRGSASVVMRSTANNVLYAAGFFDPEGDVEGLAMVLAVAKALDGRITNDSGDVVDSEDLLKVVRSRCQALSEPVYRMAAGVGLVPERIDFNAIKRPVNPWAEVQ